MVGKERARVGDKSRWTPEISPGLGLHYYQKTTLFMEIQAYFSY